MNEKKGQELTEDLASGMPCSKRETGGKYAGTALPLEEKQLPALHHPGCVKNFSCPEESVPTI